MSESKEQHKTKCVVYKSPQFNKIWNFLRENLEVPDGVKDLTLHMGVDSVVEIELKYYPAFKGTVEEDKDTDAQ